MRICRWDPIFGTPSRPSRLRAREITPAMELAAAEALAAVVKPDELAPDYIVPSVFNREVAPAVARAVSAAAERSGAARKRHAVPAPDPAA